MFRNSATWRNAAAFYEFVDSNFLHNKRPAIPGGAWPLESLRQKSLADLQQIWLMLAKERNMLGSTKAHYLRHQEELGAMPAPSRLKMIEESMNNVKRVVKERDAEATAQAVAIFKDRLAKGVYAYPPGPPEPPGRHDKTSCIKVILSKHVDTETLRELFGRFDRFEGHKGIVSIDLQLPEEILKQKQEAEQLWQQYMTERSDTRNYHKWCDFGPSVYDHAQAEIVPGVVSGGMRSSIGKEDSSVSDADIVVAATLPVPPPKTRPDPPSSPLDRLKYEKKSFFNKAVIQLGYFPNTTLHAPRFKKENEIPRPVHPDEIEGPWEAIITYDFPDGIAYAESLGIKRIHGADVISVSQLETLPKPSSEVSAVYQEAVQEEQAREETLMKWPHVPTWKNQYNLYTRKHLAEIVQYNYSNVVDYVDREVLLTGRSVWESPIDIDPTCGGAKSVPAHAQRPKQWMTRSISDVGVCDL